MGYEKIEYQVWHDSCSNQNNTWKVIQKTQLNIQALNQFPWCTIFTYNAGTWKNFFDRNPTVKQTLPLNKLQNVNNKNWIQAMALTLWPFEVIGF